MKQVMTVAVTLLLALPLIAGEKPDAVFASYEQARQALLKDSLADVKTAANGLGAAARNAGRQKLGELADQLEKSADLKAARVGFAAVSDEALKYRESVSGRKPVVAYCAMEKKSWLQPAGHTEIGNPYAASMRTCGEIKQQ